MNPRSPYATLALALIAGGGAASISGCNHHDETPPVAVSTATTQPPLPDLVINDIILKAKAQAAGPNEGEVIINVAIQNTGTAVADIDKPQLDIVRCSYECTTAGILHQSTWNYAATKPLQAGETVVLGDDAWLTISDACPPVPSRKISCKVDPDERVPESNESNNESSKDLDLGR